MQQIESAPGGCENFNNNIIISSDHDYDDTDDDD